MIDATEGPTTSTPTAEAASEEATLKSAFPSMFQGTATATQASPPPPPAAQGEDAALRSAFPSMYADAPAPQPAAAPEPQLATSPATPETTPATPPAAPEVAVLPSARITINVPAGFALDPTAVGAFDAAARDLGLDAAGAQRLFDLHHQGVTGLVSEADAAWSTTVAEWRSAVQKDPELGGARFTESVAAARQVIGRYGTPALKQMLNELGIGNHPELVRLMVRVGRALGQQGVSPGSATDGDEALLRSFPSMRRR